MGKDTGKKYRIMIIILLLILIGVGGYLVYHQISDKPQYKGTSGYIDEEASEWDAGLSQPSEITGRILVPGYSGATMKAGDTTLRLRIGNPAENTCYLQATLQLEDGTVLYESNLIEPGKGFDEITLLQTLEPGTYEASVHYQGYSMDDEPEILNSCDSAFKLTVTE